MLKKNHVFPRLTEVVLERTFDIDSAKQFVLDKKLNVYFLIVNTLFILTRME